MEKFYIVEITSAGTTQIMPQIFDNKDQAFDTASQVIKANNLASNEVTIKEYAYNKTYSIVE